MQSSRTRRARFWMVGLPAAAIVLFCLLLLWQGIARGFTGGRIVGDVLAVVVLAGAWLVGLWLWEWV